MVPYLQSPVSVGDNPCTTSCTSDNCRLLQNLSCAAAKNQLSVVVNVAMGVPCSHPLDDEEETEEEKEKEASSSSCPPDGMHHYNSNVALSKDGDVLAVYHKTHLYFEPAFDSGKGDSVIFVIDDWRIGLAVCFDIWFARPVGNMVDAKAIDILALPMWWVNFPPLITALSSQLAFATASNINLLAANSGASSYNSGSGIYQHSQALGVTQTLKLYNPAGTHHVITEKLNDDIVEVEEKNQKMIPLQDDKGRQTSPTCNSTVPFTLPGNGTAIEVNTHAGDVSCKVTIEGQGQGALFALEGWYNGILPMRICSVVSCTDGICGQGSDSWSSSMLINHVALEGNFSLDNTIIFPMHLLDQGELVPVRDFTAPKVAPIQWEPHLESVPQSLMSLTLWGRVYNEPSAVLV